MIANDSKSFFENLTRLLDSSDELENGSVHVLVNAGNK